MSTFIRPSGLDAPVWMRGTARHEAGYIHLEEPRPYSIFDNEPSLVFDFADVKDVNGCVAFASERGLLTHGDPHPGGELREPVTEWLAQAEKMRRLLQLWHGVRTAILTSDITILKNVWDEHLEPAPAATTDDELVMESRWEIEMELNSGLRNVKTRVAADWRWEDGAPLNADGWFSYVTEPQTLLDSLYHQLSMVIVQRIEARSCLNCGRPFLPADTRQRYCSPTCSSRSRYKRFAEKRQRESVDAVDAGDARL